MGDRAMCEIRTEDGPLFVYTHWHGNELPEMSKEAIIKAEPRWNDDPYATRIIVDQLTVSGRDDECGWGLMVKPRSEDSYNNNKPSVVIDLANRHLIVVGHGEHNCDVSFEELKQTADA